MLLADSPWLCGTPAQHPGGAASTQLCPEQLIGAMESPSLERLLLGVCTLHQWAGSHEMGTSPLASCPGTR